MPLTPKSAEDTARELLEGPAADEAPRLHRIANALRPDYVPTVNLPAQVANMPVVRELALKARTNFLPLIVDVFSQSMKVDGYRSSNTEQDAAGWEAWQANQLDARQTGVHRSALAYGASYVTVMPGTPTATIEPSGPRHMTAVYEDAVIDEWPVMALRRTGRGLYLYDATSEYQLVRQDDKGVSDRLQFVARRDHGLGVCPVVRFRDRMLLDEDEQMGLVEPVLAIQQRVDETVFGLLVAQYYSAFKQRYVIGWVPQTEAEQLRASAAHLWAFDDPDVKVGDLAETDLTRYLDSASAAVRDMAVISQVEPQRLSSGISNVSAEALALVQEGKDRKTDEVTTSLGESWEQALRLAARISGQAPDLAAQVRWKDATARSLAQTVDALGKMVQMLGVPPQVLWERIPGVTRTDADAWRAEAATGDAFAQLGALLEAQATPGPT